MQPDDRLDGRAGIIENVVESQNDLLWPRASVYKHSGSGELVWLAQTSRYFVFAIHPMLDPGAALANTQDMFQHRIDKRLKIAGEVHAVVRGPSADPSVAMLLLQLTSRQTLVQPGATEDLSFGAYAGPLGRKQLVSATDPILKASGLDRVVIYNLGGPCAWCTFQWLAQFLLWFLTFLHDNVVFDWAIAIMLLVVCVRAVLHPITRRSQLGMMRFSKQMASLAPKQQKLREKYKNEPKRMQEEMIKLMREEKVNYGGILGCLPMFLQSPVWFALYAMLYFSFDLRHEPGYFGVFQAVTGGAWSFLGDLSVADHFIYFGQSIIKIPLLGHVTGINVLPVLMGVLFWFQQKYMTPPTTNQLTPEQEMQQKMMKAMMVFMMPLLMYNAPSGLVVYFITNSTLGIIESRWIRAHADKLDAAAAGKAYEPQPIFNRKKVDNTAKRHPKGK